MEEERAPRKKFKHYESTPNVKVVSKFEEMGLNKRLLKGKFSRQECLTCRVDWPRKFLHLAVAENNHPFEI